MHTRTTRRQFRLQRQTFSIWRPCWRPYWISRLAIIYANLCQQFQKLQTIGNILIYDTSCCTGGSGLPLERVASFTHCHPTNWLLGLGGTLGFQISRILAIFDLQVSPMLPSKFRVNWPFGSGVKRKIDFQDGHHLGFPFWTILAIFDL